MNTQEILELAEGYIDGTLTQETTLFIDQQLITGPLFKETFEEHTAFLQSLKAAGNDLRFRNTLQAAGKKHAQKEKVKRAMRYPLTPQFWRTAAIAAGVALITSGITFSVLNKSFQKSDTQYRTISREVSHIKNQQQQLQQQQAELINTISKNTAAAPKADARYTGTGFALTNDGYFVTAYHVINDGKGDFDSVYIQNQDGDYFKAFLVNFDAKSDIAIMKVEKKNFRFGKGEIPYAFSAAKSGLGTQIFTLGFPKDDAVYSEGYISGRNGFAGNDQQYTLQLPAGHGQSGSPVVDAQGNVTAMLTAIGNPGEANTYAVSSGALLDLIKTLPAGGNLHLAHYSKMAHLTREQQIEKMENYTFSVKVYKK